MTADRPIAWPTECYPPSILAQYPFLQQTPGPRALRSVLPRYLRTGLHVLDIGCGPGIGACHLAASDARDVTYTGVDPDAAACERARHTLAALPRDSVRGRIIACSVQEYLETDPSPVDLALWTYSFHDCADATDERATRALCAAVTALLPSGGQLVLMDGCFAPGASADEIERTYAHMERIVGHSDRGRYFSPDTIARLFTESGMSVIERHDVPLVAMARFIGIPHARAALFVLAR